MTGLPLPVMLAVTAALVGAEAAFALLQRRFARNLPDTAVNVLFGATNAVLDRVLWAAPKLAVLAALSGFAPWRLAPEALWTWPLALVVCDFLSYWEHRTAHRCRLLWALHSVHHSSTRFNALTLVRASWFVTVYRAVFLAPMALLGFDLVHVAVAAVVVTTYQFLIHSDNEYREPRLLALVFNMPSHHRVHHAADPRYFDTNFGAMLIVWDRLFGTFAAETERLPYGVAHPPPAQDPLTVQFHELALLFRDVLAARSLADAVKRLVMPPAWTPAEAAAPLATTTLPGGWRVCAGPLAEPAVRALWDQLAARFHAQFASAPLLAAKLPEPLHAVLLTRDGELVAGGLYRARRGYLRFGAPLTLGRPLLVMPGAPELPLAAALDWLLGREGAVFAVLHPVATDDPSRQALAGECLTVKASPGYGMDLRGVASADEYAAQWDARRRKRLRRALRGLTRAGLRPVVKDLRDADPAELAALHQRVLDRRGVRLQVAFEDYFRALQAGAAGEIRVFGLYRDDRLVAFDLLCGHKLSGDLEVPIVGFDHAAASGAPVYEGLFLAEVDLLARDGRPARRIDIGQGADKQKRRLGARASAREALVFFKGAQPRRVAVKLDNLAGLAQAAWASAKGARHVG